MKKTYCVKAVVLNFDTGIPVSTPIYYDVSGQTYDKAIRIAGILNKDSIMHLSKENPIFNVYFLEEENNG